MMLCPKDWRPSAASRTRRSAPPIPRSGCRKRMRNFLFGDGSNFDFNLAMVLLCCF